MERRRKIGHLLSIELAFVAKQVETSFFASEFKVVYVKGYLNNLMCAKIAIFLT